MKRKKFNFYQTLERPDKIKITEIEREIQNTIINIKKDSFAIGKLLCKAKEILSHGEFIPWIKTTFAEDLPYSTANFYMQIYKSFEKQPGIVQVIPIKYLIDITQKQFPEEALKVIKEQVENDSIELWQLDQVSEFFDLMKKGTLGGNKFLANVKSILEDGEKVTMDELKNQNKHRMNTNARRSLNFGLGDLLKRLDAAINMAHEMAGRYPFDPNSSEHKRVVNKIEKTREKLKALKVELCGGSGLFKPTSTKEGEKYV